MSDKYPGGFVTANAPAGFSVALNGSTDYLTTANSLGINNFGTGDFTIESWINFNVVGNGQIVSAGDGSVSNAYFWQYYSSQLSFGAQSIGSIAATNWSPVANTWYHVAVTRSGTSVRQFVNGVQLGSTVTSSQNFIDGPTWIGNAGAGYFNGYISNVRVIKGTALYTTTFTPPTQLFPVTNTTLLTCQSPTLVDNSTTAATITAVSGAKVSNFTPFAAYQGFNPALGAAAGGVWTLDEASYYQNNRQWPIYDPYFNQTTLMLHGNGTNGAQNNTFLDSSANNFTITRNGNTTQGSFSPFSQTGWSNYFDGTDDRLITSTALFVYPTGGSASTQTATVEAMVYLNAYNASKASIGENAAIVAKGSTYMNFGINDTGKVFLYHYDGSVRTTVSAGSVSLNTWTHVAFTLSAGVITLYINGVAQSLSSGSSTWYGLSVTSGSSYIGESTDASSSAINGYLSNIRVSTIARTITVPTAPLVADTSTVFLTSQSNRFVDNSANNYAITVDTGTPSVQAFSPFVPAYITPTTYSNYFDGSTGYLSFPSSANFTFGTGDYTVEAWVNLNSSSTYQTMFGSSTTDALMFNIYSMNSVVIQTAGSNIFATFSGATFATNTWYHVAVSRSSGTVKAFVNGVQYGSTITSNTTNYALPTTNTIGANAASQYFGGCLSNLRIVKGGALYTSNFTPSTEPLTTTVSAGTVSLLTCQNSTFIDNSVSANTLTATGSVKPVTSPTPFPAKVDTTTLNSAYSTSLIGGSGYFDGTGDYLSCGSQSAYAFGTGNFTFEAWVYVPNRDAQYNIAATRASAGTVNGWNINITTSGGIVVFTDNFVFNNVGTVPLNAWTHIAFTREGTGTNQTKIYINGVNVASATNSQNFSNTTLGVGNANDGSQYPFLGYISGVRLVKGTAVYTANFAPPVAPLTNVTNTSLLLNYTNGAIFDNTAKNVLETVGNAQISTTQSKWGGSSMYFDGTGDWLIAANGRNYINGTEPFTIECWVYITGTPNYWSICGASSGTLVLTIQNLTTININPYGSANTLSATTSLSINTWTHIAATRNSANRFDIWVNGVSAGNATSSQSFGSPTNYVIGAADSGGTQAFIGYIDDLRITKGVARYITNFTPPTSQLQDQ